MSERDGSDIDRTKSNGAKVGIIGVGTIAKALTVGLSAFGEPRAEVILSPRNRMLAEQLALQYLNVRVAVDNQAVVDASDIVVLAVRPDVAPAVLGAARFRPDQEVLSLIATFSVGQLAPIVAPAARISRAVPLPPVAQRQGPLAVYTASPAILHLLNGLGQLIQLEDESQLDLVSAATSLMATYFGMAGAVDEWLVQRGFSSSAAREFVSELLLNLATAAQRSPAPYKELSREYSTPGGLNEQAWRELKAVGWNGRVQDALDLILARIHGRATAETRIADGSHSEREENTLKA